MLPHWTENNVIVDGATFHYYRTGDGSKPTLLLAHGFSDNGLNWLPVARDLESEFDVILPDARGHGKSQRVQPGEAIDNAGDLARIIQALHLDRPIVGGHSMGGSSTSDLAARYPQLVRALILEDPAWRDPEPKKETNDQSFKSWFEWLKGLPAMALEDVMAKGRADNPTWAEVEILPWAESKKQLDLNVLSRSPSFKDWRVIARAIVCPTLLVTAEVEKGAIVTPQAASEACQMNSYIHEAHIPGAGHNIRRENYPAYMEAVRRFLSKID
jgi:N-formylmaleamate deformylase